MLTLSLTLTELDRSEPVRARVDSPAMGSLNASAKLRWKGYLGQIEGSSGALDVATATQSELGGPGGKSNPEELFSAALANCFTSTLTEHGAGS